MKRLRIGFIIGIFCLSCSCAFASSNDSERSLKEMERSMKMQAGRARELERQQGFSQSPKTISTDRAMVKNQERLQAMIDAQKPKTPQSDAGYFGIPRAYKGIVDFMAIIFFMSFAGFIFYRKRIKKREVKEVEDAQDKKKKELRQYYKYYKTYYKENEDQTL